MIAIIVATNKYLIAKPGKSINDLSMEDPISNKKAENIVEKKLISKTNIPKTLEYPL